MQLAALLVCLASLSWWCGGGGILQSCNAFVQKIMMTPQPEKQSVGRSALSSSRTRAHKNHDGYGFTVMKSAIVLIDPVTDWKQVIKAGLELNHTIITIQMPDVALPEKFQSFLPSTDALIAAGATYALSMHHRDVFAITRQLQVLAEESNLQIAGVVPLSEVAAEISDLVASCLGLPHNPLKSMTARRDKGLMKRAVHSSGLRVAKHARIQSIQELCETMTQLSLTYPTVIKTPSGMSTTDVHICHNEEEAEHAIKSIVGGTGPDGRPVEMALLEEYIDGTEFAINLMAFNDTTSKLLVTDMWKYRKTKKARYDSAEICNPANHPDLITYACNVAKAVGIQYGAAHVELKAKQDVNGNYVDPVMIEVGARLSGGRKSSMAQAAIEDWDPFTSLIESHYGGSGQRIPSNVNYLMPRQFVRHIFLPIEKGGRIKEVKLDVPDLETMHSSAIIVKPGDVVKETTDIVSCAGFVWLVGEKGQVETDAEKVLPSFSLVIDDES